MTTIPVSSSEFSQGPSDALLPENNGLVLTTDPGEAPYPPLTTRRRDIVDALAMRGIADIEFGPPRADIQSRPVDFS